MPLLDKYVMHYNKVKRLQTSLESRVLFILIWLWKIFKQAGDGLCLQQLEALAKMVPTDEEEAKLSSYNGDINELGSAERFVKAMLDIPFAFLRIEAMLYKETFEDEVVHLRKSFSMLEVITYPTILSY